MPLRTTDGRLLCGEEHAREMFVICAALRGTAEGDGHGSDVPAGLQTGCAQVLHHCWCSIRAIRHPRKHIRRCACTTRELRELVVCLQELAVEHVAMESTGGYGKPVWNILEGHFPILLAKAQHIKAVPGRQTDTKDCPWSAELLQHGPASFPRG